MLIFSSSSRWKNKKWGSPFILKRYSSSKIGSADERDEPSPSRSLIPSGGLGSMDLFCLFLAFFCAFSTEIIFFKVEFSLFSFSLQTRTISTSKKEKWNYRKKLFYGRHLGFSWVARASLRGKSAREQCPRTSLIHVKHCWGRAPATLNCNFCVLSWFVCICQSYLYFL